MTIEPISLEHEHFTVVIPAFNEVQYISHLLDLLCQMSGYLTQIIVVDDGSLDNTAAVVQSYGEQDNRVQLLRLPTNRGKGGAMVAGAEASVNDLVVFLDADLRGLSVEHIVALIQPLWQNECCMALGVFTKGRWHTDWSHRLTPFLSGQRCLRWSLFGATPDLATARAGVEIALSLYARRHGYRVQMVPWSGVTHVMKAEKVGRFRGWWSYLRMYSQITRYLAGHFIEHGKLTTLTRYRRWAKPRYLEQ